MKTRLVVVDDHILFRQALCSLLSSQSSLEVIGEAGNGLDAVKMVKKLKPDIAILDISMQLLNGIDAARQIHRTLPQVKILALSMHADRRFVEKMLEVGATGYITKNTVFNELLECIRRMNCGEIYLCSSVAQRVFREYAACLSAIKKDNAAVLTVRQVEVLQQIAEGRTTKEIALELGISIKTVETYRNQIMTRLNIHSVAGLTRFALSEGISESQFDEPAIMLHSIKRVGHTPLIEVQIIKLTTQRFRSSLSGFS